MDGMPSQSLVDETDVVRYSEMKEANAAEKAATSARRSRSPDLPHQKSMNRADNDVQTINSQ
jgi:hypothetical protein